MTKIESTNITVMDVSGRDPEYDNATTAAVSTTHPAGPLRLLAKSCSKLPPMMTWTSKSFSSDLLRRQCVGHSHPKNLWWWLVDKTFRVANKQLKACYFECNASAIGDDKMCTAVGKSQQDSVAWRL
mmetsp:Transcript_22080/g.53474  ORF Transcript_22080/g.53474 Transcript_22080/m.53474 type:complete len:127 (-) Transcript_22080:150-530(-)